MLNSISWTQFFTAVGIIASAYYLITVLLLFSHEIKAFLKGRSSKSSPSSDSDDSLNPLGRTRPEPKRIVREGYVSSESLNIVRSETPEDPIHSPTNDEELLTGSVADLLEEVKTKLSSMSDWNKDEVLGALRELLEKSPALKDTGYRDSISYFISMRCADHFTWSVEPEEIDKLWS